MSKKRLPVFDTKSAMSLKGITWTRVAKYDISIASQCQNINVPKNNELNKAIRATGFVGNKLHPLIVNALHK